MAICVVCGGPAPAAERCTNGCCGECHRRHCTPGGVTSPGHALRRPETDDERDRNDAQAAKALALVMGWCAWCNGPNPSGVGEAIKIAPAVWVCSPECQRGITRHGETCEECDRALDPEDPYLVHDDEDNVHAFCSNLCRWKWTESRRPAA